MKISPLSWSILLLVLLTPVIAQEMLHADVSAFPKDVRGFQVRVVADEPGEHMDVRVSGAESSPTLTLRHGPETVWLRQQRRTHAGDFKDGEYVIAQGSLSADGKILDTVALGATIEGFPSGEDETKGLQIVRGRLRVGDAGNLIIISDMGEVEILPTAKCKFSLREPVEQKPSFKPDQLFRAWYGKDNFLRMAIFVDRGKAE